MTPDLQSLADEFVSSQEFLLSGFAAGEDGPGLLHAVMGALPRDGMSIVGLERALMECAALLDCPHAAKRQIPALIKEFFSWCASSGAWPPAREWAGWIDLLGPKFLAKFRDDGSVKGETFIKNYTDVHRNDPCPCGSGKKFKKCCMGFLG